MKRLKDLPKELKGLDRPLQFRTWTCPKNGRSSYHWEEVETGIVVPRKLINSLHSRGRVTVKRLNPKERNAVCWVVEEVESEEMEP